MSNLAAIERRFARLQEIGGILAAMKNLSLVESRKLARFIGQQQRMLDNIVAAGADFTQFHVPSDEPPKHVIVLIIGSERGFCGNFNERVIAALADSPEEADAANSPWLIGVGRRIESKLAKHPCLLTTLEGATVAEDVPGVLDDLMDALHAARTRLNGGVIAFDALAWEAEGDPRRQRILPFTPASSPRYSSAPLLYLPPADFLSGLTEQYLLAAFHGLLYGSLAAENRRRVEHMENALERLDEITAQLSIRRNALRKEQIVEEIEVILSGVKAQT